MKKKIFCIAAIIFIAIIGIVLACDIIVSHNAKGRLYDSIDSTPHRRAALVLGTSPISIWTGRRNIYFDNRIYAAADLYKAGKADYLIVSGGDYRNSEANGYDEPVAMRDSLMKLGVDSARIVLDYNGTRTLNSIAMIKNTYGIDSITIVSQKYHNERALYQADHIGVDAIAYNAITPPHKQSWIRNRGREFLARVKLFLDLIFGTNPSTPKSPLTNFESDNSGKTLLSLRHISTSHGDMVCISPLMDHLTIDLECGKIPDAQNDSIVLAFAGAFTGTMWDKGHLNIAGDHVANGLLFKGYRCRRNTGAFTWSAKSGPQFHYLDYGNTLAQAASEGGMGFTQEMMIHGGDRVTTTRPLGNKNQFRALCLDKQGQLAVYESCGVTTFGNFISALLEAGVTEALYTDMGPGWNYCFYRHEYGRPATFLHKTPQSHASNFIVFKIK